MTHGFLQVPAAQTYGSQLVPDTERQLPVPLHWRSVTVVPEHVALPHDVPAVYLSHVPCPLQLPLVSQELAPLSVHSLSGSAPAAIVPQAPSAPEPFLTAVQASQTPPHPPSQQTPP